LSLLSESPLSPTLATSTYKLLKGQEVELLDGQLAIQELQQQKNLELAKKARKEGENKVVQTGGVIHIGDARLKVQKWKESEVELAERALRRTQAAEKRPFKLVFKEAGKAKY
jgi:hypothetical protein